MEGKQVQRVPTRAILLCAAIKSDWCNGALAWIACLSMLLIICVFSADTGVESMAISEPEHRFFVRCLGSEVSCVLVLKHSPLIFRQVCSNRYCTVLILQVSGQKIGMTRSLTCKEIL